jgi:hypothetical protein
MRIIPFGSTPIESVLQFCLQEVGDNTFAYELLHLIINDYLDEEDVLELLGDACNSGIVPVELESEVLR